MNMNEKEKQDYLKKYKEKKEKGIPFFPDILYKDAVVGLIVFVILLALAIFVGVPLEARADPTDTTYNPRPEWYFLFLFQLLKYFPGKLEVIGVVVIPTLAILTLIALPFLDSSRFRHFTNRKLITGGTVLVVAAMGVLTVLASVASPAPEEVASGDQTAALYAQNCAGCHGSTINVPMGTNLHDVIARGNHEGMPPWSADLTNDQIDALAGFILSPTGSTLFTEYCGKCHEAVELVSVSPLELKSALDEGQSYASHAEVEIPDWEDVLSPEELTSLLNFLTAPDGERLFVTNCSPCHGSSVTVRAGEEELRQTISQGGLHLEMPGWQGQLPQSDLETLAKYVVDPAATPAGETLYQQYCSSCHFDRIPTSDSYEQALETIATGGSHETMPVWGNVLTQEQLDALVAYTYETALGTSTEVGRQLFVQNCSSCHGEFGEGGLNPTREGDIIPPISSEEFLNTRDDATLKAIISQGQPNLGMSPFGVSSGGHLDDTQIDTLVSFIRSWEDNPPVEFPPEVQTSSVSLSGAEIFQGACAQCHGSDANGGIGPSLRNTEFREENTSDTIFNAINLGRKSTSMIAWGEILTSEQIKEIVDYLLQLPESEEGASAGEISYAAMVAPIFQSNCQVCHNDSGAFGGWDSVGYDNVMNSGNNAPVIIPGDVDNSLLAQAILYSPGVSTHMPPSSQLDEATIQIILDWIAAGAPNN
jgi:mono/diheme cytochrome c family protein